MPISKGNSGAEDFRKLALPLIQSQVIEGLCLRVHHRPSGCANVQIDIKFLAMPLVRRTSGTAEVPQPK